MPASKFDFDFIFKRNPAVKKELAELGITLECDGEEDEACPCLKLPSGAKLIIAKDYEGNGAGAIFVVEPDYSSTHYLSNNILERAEKAIKKFGSYSFDDKGPAEVMDLRPIADELRTKTAAQVRDILLEIRDSERLAEGRGVVLAACLVVYLEDWDELFDHPEICALHN